MLNRKFFVSFIIYISKKRIQYFRNLFFDGFLSLNFFLASARLTYLQLLFISIFQTLIPFTLDLKYISPEIC